MATANSCSAPAVPARRRSPETKRRREGFRHAGSAFPSIDKEV
jgi:hypothetical protein